VPAQYEEVRVELVGAFQALEDQMAHMKEDSYRGSRSPDSVDALVWALTELMMAPVPVAPHVRSLG
jgi:Uncharacterized conserved protein